MQHSYSIIEEYIICDIVFLRQLLVKLDVLFALNYGKAFFTLPLFVQLQ